MWLDTTETPGLYTKSFNDCLNCNSVLIANIGNKPLDATTYTLATVSIKLESFILL